MIVTIASFKGGVGKTTTALHLAAYLQTKAPTLLVDGDLNRSALDWAARGSLPFKVVDEKQGVRFARDYDHIVIDLLILPSSPDAMALTAMVQMVEALHSLKSNYRILLTLIPPAPSKVGIESRRTIEKAELPIFKAEIRRLAVFQKAALAGVPVNAVKDAYAKAAWGCYAAVGKEILP
jgi:chromosome partitioning protein